MSFSILAQAAEAGSEDPSYALQVLAAAGGVVISVVLPILSKYVKSIFGGAAATEPLYERVWRFAKPYLALAVFSIIVAAIVVAFLDEEINTLQAALLAGYVSDATLQKIATPQ